MPIKEVSFWFAKALATALALANAISGSAVAHTARFFDSSEEALKLISEIDRLGRTTTYGYSSGALSTVTGPRGHRLTVAWYGPHVTRVTRPDGKSVQYAYCIR